MTSSIARSLRRAGAIVLRAAFIVAGVALLDRFEVMHYIFGALLLYTAWRLFRPKGPQAPPSLVDSPSAVRQCPAPVLTIELTDVIFAIDSVPAVLAVTNDTFIVYTSNIFAILGLRSLYFALLHLLHRLHLLHYGLAVILAFVGGKMIAARWFEIPITISLVIMGAILALALLFPLRGHKPA